MKASFNMTGVSMQEIQYSDGRYLTSDRARSLISSLFPTVIFYLRLTWIVFRSAAIARFGNYDGRAWVQSSLRVKNWLEKAGVSIEITGVRNLQEVEGPVVIVGNHMSMMETMVLPGIIQPIMPVTYVIKESLLHYPVFKYVMRSRNPIAVTRTNPRQDLKTVMQEGAQKLADNISIIVFPQTTRTQAFDPAQMSSIGVKLAKKAGVPIVPLALKTECWENGLIAKDFGKINGSKKARFSFGKAMRVAGKGDAEQEAINQFIVEKLAQWQDT